MSNVSPTLLRVELRKDWKSRWFTSNNTLRRVWIKEDNEIVSILHKFYGQRHGIYSFLIERPSVSKVRLVIYSSRVSSVIGKRGEKVNRFTELVKTHTHKNVEVHAINDSLHSLNAKTLADEACLSLQKGMRFRRVINLFLENINGICQGGKIQISGKLDGVQIARKESGSVGKLPLNTRIMNIEEGYSHIVDKWGVIGVKVEINHGLIEKANK